MCVYFTLGPQRVERQIPIGTPRKKECSVPGRRMLKLDRGEFWEEILAEENYGRKMISASRAAACCEGSELRLHWEASLCSQDTDAQIWPVVRVISLA